MIALDTSNHSSCVKTLTAMTDQCLGVANVDKGGGSSCDIASSCYVAIWPVRCV